MSGTQEIHFSELFADTAKTHGVQWAWKYYSKRGMGRKEFRFWCVSTLI